MTTTLQMLVESSLRICIVAAAVWISLVICRIRAGAVSHSAWTAVLMTMLVVPVLPGLIPPIHFPVPEAALNSNVLHNQLMNLPSSISVTTLQRPSSVTTETVTTVQPVDAVRRLSPEIVFFAYLIGVFALLGRLAMGWFGTTRIVGTRIPAPEAGSPNVFESVMVTVPMTVGVISPRIILPSVWKTWSVEKLRAVLAHEKSHVRRRDPLVMLLARINCCIFWFHPVAWFLNRRLALTSEMACDEAVLAQTQDNRGYARILIELADDLRRHGRRFSWEGVGIHGSGSLNRRIDFILYDSKQRAVSTTRKTFLALACAAAIVVSVACQRAPAPLREDSQFSAQQIALKERGDFVYKAGHMSVDEAITLEDGLKKDPEDLVARKKLLVYYSPDFTNNAVARRRHVLWLIERHPDDEVLHSSDARIFSNKADTQADPIGYGEAKRLWLDQTAKVGSDVKVLGNAAAFFEIADKPIAEELLLRAKSIDPGGPWARQLGMLYAHVVVGSDGDAWTTGSGNRAVSLAEARSPYAVGIRKKLNESTDDKLLSEAGQFLTIYLGRVSGLDFDPRPLGVSYLERALQLNPQSTQAHAILVSMRRSERLQSEGVKFGDDSRLNVVASFPPDKRFDSLPELIQWSFMRAQDADYHEKPAAAKSAWDTTERYGRDLLSLASTFQKHPNYGTAIYVGNLALSGVALHNGNQRQAVRYLRDAANAPNSEELAYSTDGITTRVVGQLLKHGERESVIEFLEKIAQIKVWERNQLLQSAAAVRDGRMPVWYQTLVH